MKSVFQLKPHRNSVHSLVRSIEAIVWPDAERLHFRFFLEGADSVMLPDPATPGRKYGLWRTTCFEAFIGASSGSYTEMNFSPSGQWAAYAFDAPRGGMRNAEVECETWLEGGADWIALEATVSGNFPADAKLGLSAVIEEKQGSKSYWALAHCGDQPDFHNPDCFVARLP